MGILTVGHKIGLLQQKTTEEGNFQAEKKIENHAHGANGTNV